MTLATWGAQPREYAGAQPIWRPRALCSRCEESVKNCFGLTCADAKELVESKDGRSHIDSNECKRTAQMPAEPPIFTVGHSTRSIPGFAELLRCGQVSLIVDVRTVPRSRHNPQYNEDVLGSELTAYQVGYTRIPGLGGLRGRAVEVPRALNAFWENESFHNYADYALSDQFEEAFVELLETSSTRRCAIMCAEAVWWRCHRRIITDYLLTRGRNVIHLMGADRLEEARLTPGAEIADGKVVYPVQI